MTKTELKKNITKIKKLLKQRDYDIIDTGIELARGLDEPAVFETLLEGCSIEREGKLVRNKIFTGTGPAQPYLDYALVNLIGCAPKDTKVDKGLEHANIKTLSLTDFSELPSGLANLTKLTSLDLRYCESLKNIDGLANLTNLTSLDLQSCFKLQNVDGLVNCTNLTTLNLDSCKTLQNVDGLANCTNLTSLNLCFCQSLQNVDGLANLTNLTSLDLTYCSSLQNVDGLANLTNLTSLVLYNCNSLQNVDVLENLTNLTSLDLTYCSSLQNVELIQLQELKVLSMDGCNKVKPLPRPMNMETRSEVESYFRSILKKAGRKIPDSLKPKTPKDLKSNLAKIKKFIRKRDHDTIDQGIELMRALDDPAIFESLLAGCSINENGKLLGNRLFTGTGPAQPYLDYALVNLIGYAPKNTKVDKSLEHANIKTLSLTNSSLQNLDVLANLTNLTSLDLSICESLQNVDGLENLTNLTSLDLQECDSLQNVDGLANLTNLTSLVLSYCKFSTIPSGLNKIPKLTSLNLSGCDSLQNVDGLANLPNLTSLDLRYCDSLENADGIAKLENLFDLNLSECPNIKPKPSPVRMTTREEVAAYQEDIKKSMK
jgi:internalin A